MSEITLQFDDIKAQCKHSNTIPRFHGNGFVQLDLVQGRLNVWPSQRIQMQKVNTQIHDHRFSFKSRVIAGNGKLIHKVYEPWFTPAGDMDLYRAVPAEGQNTILQKLPDSSCYMVIQSETRVWNEYTFEKGLFHETITEGLLMTLMEKTQNDISITARIACYKDNAPDNEFDRHTTVSTDDCWDIIRDAFKQINRHWVNPYNSYQKTK